MHVALALAVSPLVLTSATAQQTPTDAKVLHDVSAVLENEKAFRGLVIVPKVSHGMVTLTGTVSSEGDKVLASIEVGQVNGVKTVLNNLEVSSASASAGHLPALANPSGAQTQQLTTEAHPQDGSVTAKTVTVPVNTYIEVRLSDAITTKTAKADDQFHGTVTAPVYADGAIAIPAGTPILGRVVSAKPPGHFVSPPSSPLSLRPSGYRSRRASLRMSPFSPSTCPATAKDVAPIPRPRPEAGPQLAPSSARSLEEEPVQRSEPPAAGLWVSAPTRSPLAVRLN